jgi:hypothetical protein
MESKITTIRLTIDEKRYARALSLRAGGCKLTETGSVSYALKWLLHREAQRENIPLGGVYKKTEVYTS